MGIIVNALAGGSAELHAFYEGELGTQNRCRLAASWLVKNVATLGHKEKYYLAGALHRRAGKGSYVGDSIKNTESFISLLSAHVGGELSHRSLMNTLSMKVTNR